MNCDQFSGVFCLWADSGAHRGAEAVAVGGSESAGRVILRLLQEDEG